MSGKILDINDTDRLSYRLIEALREKVEQELSEEFNKVVYGKVTSLSRSIANSIVDNSASERWGFTQDIEEILQEYVVKEDEEYARLITTQNTVDMLADEINALLETVEVRGTASDVSNLLNSIEAITLLKTT